MHELAVIEKAQLLASELIVGRGLTHVQRAQQEPDRTTGLVRLSLAGGGAAMTFRRATKSPTRTAASAWCRSSLGPLGQRFAKSCGELCLLR